MRIQPIIKSTPCSVFYHNYAVGMKHLSSPSDDLHLAAEWPTRTYEPNDIPSDLPGKCLESERVNVKNSLHISMINELEIKKYHYNIEFILW
jgi:hypothetical protein